MTIIIFMWIFSINTQELTQTRMDSIKHCMHTALEIMIEDNTVLAGCTFKTEAPLRGVVLKGK